MRETMQRMKPAKTDDLSTEVRFFLALRAGDRAEVARLIAADPALANARQQWAPDLVVQGLLPFATDATALITAVELDDLGMLKLLLEAGADVDGLCGCATAESPLWAATLFNRVAHVQLLLQAGADPNLASMSGNYPLHLAAMRGLTEVVELLLAHGADSALEDGGARYPRPFSPRTADAGSGSARTAAQWARENGHEAIAQRLDEAPAAQQTRSVAENGIVAMRNGLLHTGIKAIDLFAPITRGQIIRVPFKAGVGMVVLLGELCSRFYRSAEGAAVWTGFAQPPFDLQDWQAEMAEFGLKDQVTQYLASFQDAPDARRAAFQDGVDAAMAQAEVGKDVLLIVQATEGFQGEVDAALLRLSDARLEGSVTTMVITNFPETREAVWAELSPPYGGQLVLDRFRARAHLFPALEPNASLSTAAEAVPERQQRLAERAREVLAQYQAEDPEFRNLDQRAEEPAGRLLHYLCQPFQVTEPFTGQPGEWVAQEDLLAEVATLLGGP